MREKLCRKQPLADLRIPKVKRTLIDRTGMSSRYAKSSDSGLKLVSVSVARISLIEQGKLTGRSGFPLEVHN